MRLSVSRVGQAGRISRDAPAPSRQFPESTNGHARRVSLRIGLAVSSAARYIRPAHALVAQMDRALDFESSGRGFESSPARHSDLLPAVLAARFCATVVKLGSATVGSAYEVNARGISLATGLADGYTLPTRALVAQLDRVLDYESRGRGFESSPARHVSA